MLHLSSTNQRVEGFSTGFQISVGSTTTLINQEISFRRGDSLAVRSSERVVLGDILLSSNSASYSSSGFQSGDMELLVTHIIRIYRYMYMCSVRLYLLRALHSS